MKVSLIFLILVISSSIGYSTELRDGIEQSYDVAYADSLNRLAGSSMDNDTNLTKSAATQALEISNKINYIDGQINALSTLASFYQTQGNYLKTLELYFKIIDIYEAKQDFDKIVIGYSRIVYFFLTIRDFDLAEKYIAVMARIVQKSNNSSTKGLLHFNKAMFYLAKGENDLAISSAYLAIPHYQKSKALEEEGAIYKFLGDAFLRKKMYSQADYNYHIAISLYSQVPDSAETAILYTRIAHIYQVLNNNHENLRYNLAALKIREKLGPPALFVAYSCLNVGEAYWLLGRKDSARIYLQKSLQIAEELNRPALLESIYLQLSDFAKAEKRYADALRYYIVYADYNTKKNLEANRFEILTLEANRTIRASEVQNDILNQEIQIQGLEIRNRRIQIFLFEVLFIVILSLILIVDSVARKNRKRKNELNDLNKRLLQEISVRIEAEGRLNRSEELHRFLAENTVDVISLMDASLKRIYISPSCEKFYGYTADEIIRLKSPLDLVDPAFHNTVIERLNEMFRSKMSIRYDYKVLKKDGSTFWAEANINPILDPVIHEVKNIITVVRDISERVNHEEELSENSRQKEYLLREIHNRVKNNFAILISLMNMQRDQSANSELGSSLTNLQLRVRTMSLVHEQLYQTQEISTIPFDNYLHHLALIISSSFNNSRIQLQTEIHPCNINIEMTLPLGLIVNELITNAYKYAFPGFMTGTIWVKLNYVNDETFCITVSDDGIGLPQNFSMDETQSMGSQIVGILIEQIEAKLEVTSKDGACFRILFSTSQEK